MLRAERVLWAWLVALLVGLSASSGALADERPATSATPATSSAPRRVEPAPARDDAKRSTPRRAFAGFLRAAEAGDYQRASEYLDLRSVPRGRDKRESAELASMLHRVLEWRIELTPDVLPDEPNPDGVPDDGVVLDLVDVDGEPRPLAISRVRLPTGEWAWLFSKETVLAIRPIYEASERRAIEDRVPEWLKRTSYGGMRPWQWLGLLVLGLASYAVGRFAGAVVMFAVERFGQRFSEHTRDYLKGMRRPVRLALLAATFSFGVPYLLLAATTRTAIGRVPTTLYVVSAAWAAIALVRIATSTWERRLPVDTEGDLMSRGTRTRLTMLRRVATVLVTSVAGGVVLLQFDVVRTIGLSLLASAGIASVLVGFAAQRTLGGIIAGIELSITQPLRIGDVVVFRPDEIGKVEQIYFTYVVVRLWDDRRLIVPVTRVMSEPFENWTRTGGGELLAPVDLWVDPSVPMEDLRRSFRDLCEKSPHWDRRRSTTTSRITGRCGPAPRWRSAAACSR